MGAYDRVRYLHFCHYGGCTYSCPGRHIQNQKDRIIQEPLLKAISVFLVKLSECSITIDIRTNSPDKMPQGTRTQTTYVYGGKEAFSYGILVPPLNLLSATRRHCSISLAMGRLSVVLGISEPPVTRHMVHNV